MNAIAVRTSGLGKRYGSNWALRDCTLEIPSGSVTALVGPNGAGKTTLLQMVIGSSSRRSAPSTSSVNRLAGLRARYCHGSASWPRITRCTAI
jgi:ABC-2 type transport system ATP-binding protein